MLWLLLLPFRLLFGIVFGLVALPVVVLLLPVFLVLWLPFAILRFVFRLVALVVILPIVAVAVTLTLLVAGGALFAALLLPLIPFAIVALGIWAIARATRHSPAATVIRG